MIADMFYCISFLSQFILLNSSFDYWVITIITLITVIILSTTMKTCIQLEHTFL
jgi:hypothetical protein